MLGRIVDTKTTDGIQLHGFYCAPHQQTRTIWIVVHGVNGNFYSSTLLMFLAQTAHQQGHGALIVNTRGHDLASFGSTEMPARLGSMYETIEDARLDLGGWIAWCQKEGLDRIGVMAHSLGAVKVGYALSHGLPGIDRWIALSPPRLNTDLLLRDPAKRDVFREQLEDARAYCDAGKDNHVMRVRFPLPNWVSARTFVDKYGSGDKYDYLAWRQQLRLPTLWVFGQQEVRQGSANFRDVDLALANELRENHRVHVVDSADHSYRTTRDALRDLITGWIET
ncbi:MAG: alpha/beta hydrolase [Planctomycetota bacterium]